MLEPSDIAFVFLSRLGQSRLSWPYSLGTETKDDVGVLEEPPAVVVGASSTVVVGSVTADEEAVDCDIAACGWLDRLARRAANSR